MGVTAAVYTGHVHGQKARARENAPFSECSKQITCFAILVRVYTLFWSQNGVQQSRGIRQPIGIATSRVAQLRQLLFIYGFDPGHPLISTENFTEIVLGEPLRRGS